LLVVLVAGSFEVLTVQGGEVDAVIHGLPVGVLDAFAFAIGQLGVEVAGAVNTAALAV
jgi:hypothetical protein